MKRVSALLLAVMLLLSLAVPVSAASTYTYTDKESGNKLSIPSGWDTEDVDTGLFQVKFVPSSGSALMEYGSVDLWDTLSSSAQKKTPRSEFDNDQFSKSDVADILGCKTSQVKLVTVDGKEYFRAEFEKSSTTKGISYTIDVTFWVRIDQGWMYLYYFAGSNSTLFNKFQDIVGSATYGSASSEDEDLEDSDIYAAAINAYNGGHYDDAKELFSAVPSYKDSAKYLRLIRIRNAGLNTGVGSAIYMSSLGLTDSEKNDIDAAAKDFYFADTAEVLLCNSDVACYYLVGEWNGGSKCYIHFKMNKYGGTYNIGSKLSTNYQSTFSINDGELRVDVIGSNKLTLHLTLTGPDTMEVYTYEKGGKCYTLNR